MVWGWFGLVWPQAHLLESFVFPLDLLGLELVWLGWAAGACDGIITFSIGSAWFGVGLGWLGLVWPQARVMESLHFPTDLLGLGLVWLGLAAGACDGIIAFSTGSAWFGVGNRRSHESDDNSAVRRTCPQTIGLHRVIA